MFGLAFVSIVLLLMLPINALAQNNSAFDVWKKSEAKWAKSVDIWAKSVNNTVNQFHKALTNPDETPVTCIKLKEMSPTIPPTTNKTILDNPYSILFYQAAMKAALRQCVMIGR